jgi:hypothetical protein
MILLGWIQVPASSDDGPPFFQWQPIISLVIEQEFPEQTAISSLQKFEIIIDSEHVRFMENRPMKLHS